MIEVEHEETWGFEHAVRGMRNPMNSWDKSDSQWWCILYEENECESPGSDKYVLGPNDLDLMRRLYKAGTEHRKYLRQIFVSMDITAPLYWWKEFDTYKVGTVANSCSTMHKIHAKEFELDDFSHDHLIPPSKGVLINLIALLNWYRRQYLETKHKFYWWQLIQLLPSSYNQKRTVTMNYENVMTIINQRTGHKLTEWEDFVQALNKLPYVKEIRNGN